MFEKNGAAQSLILTDEELFEITHYRRPSAQMRMLKAMGIPVRLRHDNTICVLRMHFYPSGTLPEPPEPPEPKLRIASKQAPERVGRFGVPRK